jgi:signal transduction histidine kinase
MSSPLVGVRGRYAGATLLWATAVALVVSVPGGVGGDIVSHGVWATLALLAALAAWHRSGAEPAGGEGWRLVGLGLFIAAAYSALQLLHIVVALPAPPLLLVLLTVLPYPTVVVGILLWPMAHRRQRLRGALDAVIFAGSIFFLFWATGLGMLVHDTRLGPVDVALNLAWFGGATLVLGIVAYAAGRSVERLHGPVGLIGLGVFVSMVCALLSARLTLTGEYFPAHPVELVWLTTPLFVLLAALSPHAVGSAQADQRDTTSFAGDLIIYLPAATVLAVGLLSGTADDPVAAGLGLAIGAAFIARQFVALYDGRRLANELESKVVERTLQLEESQAALVRAERMNAIGQVAVGIAHDFGNVLQAIMAQSDVLRLGITEAKPRERLDNISKAAKSATEFVRSLLRIGQPDSGERIELDLAEVVHGLAWVFRAAEESGIAVELERLQPARVLADHGQIEQVITNLVGNARDAMTEGGRLAVETGVVVRGSSTPRRWARLAVMDTGMGMTPQQIARIFEPFYTTKSAGRGTGLGLSAVYAIVSGLGGTIDVQSVPGGGSCFEVLIPVAESAPADAAVRGRAAAVKPSS